MTSFEDWKDPYALVRFYGDYGYGHMEATVYNAIPDMYRCPSIRISCQVGHGSDFSGTDTQFEKPYAERWGFLARDGDIVTMDDLTVMTPVMKKIEKRLKFLATEVGYPRSFADYTFRVLTALKLNRVCLVKTYGGRYSGAVADLPHVAMGHSWSKGDLLLELEKVQDDLCGRFKRPIGEAA